jgi:hypothetical protein
VTPDGPSPDRSRLTSGDWWFRSADGQLAVGQLPNPALSVWIVASLLGLLALSDRHATTVQGVADGALLVWALDELVRGASPFRRVLGAVVLVAHLSRLFLG